MCLRIFSPSFVEAGVRQPCDQPALGQLLAQAPADEKSPEGARWSDLFYAADGSARFLAGALTLPRRFDACCVRKDRSQFQSIFDCMHEQPGRIYGPPSLSANLELHGAKKLVPTARLPALTD
jgi:hypothetical protein